MMYLILTTRGKRLPTIVEWERARNVAGEAGIKYIDGEYAAKAGGMLEFVDGVRVTRFDSRAYTLEGQGRRIARRYFFEWVARVTTMDSPEDTSRHRGLRAALGRIFSSPERRTYPNKQLTDPWRTQYDGTADGYRGFRCVADAALGP